MADDDNTRNGDSQPRDWGNGGYGYNPDHIKYEEETTWERIEQRIEENKARKRRELGL